MFITEVTFYIHLVTDLPPIIREEEHEKELQEDEDLDDNGGDDCQSEELREVYGEHLTFSST